VQKCAGKLLASTFWDQDDILLIDYLPKVQTINVEYYSSPGVNGGHLEGKSTGEGYQGGLVLARKSPGSPVTCNPEEPGLPGLTMS